MNKDTDQLGPNQFKPMTEGLGLNHFAEGLPYAPAGTRRKPMVQFDFPQEQAHKNAVAVEELLASAQPEFAPAGFVRRVLAFCLDVSFSTAIFAFIVWVSFFMNGYDVATMLKGREAAQMFWPLTLLYAVVHLGYFLVQETTWRRTIGKALMGIRIKSSSGFAILGRVACFFIAVAPFGIGLLWCFFDSRRRCWHDVITDSEVVVAG